MVLTTVKPDFQHEQEFTEYKYLPWLVVPLTINGTLPTGAVTDSLIFDTWTGKFPGAFLHIFSSAGPVGGTLQFIVKDVNEAALATGAVDPRTATQDPGDGTAGTAHAGSVSPAFAAGVAINDTMSIPRNAATIGNLSQSDRIRISFTSGLGFTGVTFTMVLLLSRAI